MVFARFHWEPGGRDWPGGEPEDTLGLQEILWATYWTGTGEKGKLQVWAILTPLSFRTLLGEKDWIPKQEHPRMVGSLE